MSTHAHPEHFGGRGHLIGGEPRTGAAAHRRARRIFGFSGSALGILLLFAIGLVLGTLIHLNTPRARKLIAREVDAALAGSFQGHVHVERVGGIGLFGLSRTTIRIDDPGGRPVLVARGVRVRIATFAAIASALAGKGPLTIRLRDVAIDDVDVRLDTDPKGQLDLVHAFAPTSPAEPAKPDARGFELIVDRLALHHAWAHGQMAGAPPLDVDVDDLSGMLKYAPDRLEGDVLRASMAAHRLLNGADLRGSLGGHVLQPSAPGAKIDARLTWTGAVGGIEHSIRGSLLQGRIDAVVDVPAVRPQDLRKLFPGSPVEAASGAHLEAHGVLPTVDAALHARLGEATLDARADILTGEDKHIAVSFDSRNVDVHQFTKAIPPSRLALEGTIDAASKADGAVDGRLALRFLGGRLGDDDVPGATVTAELTRHAPNDLRARLDAVVHEPSAPTTLHASLFPKGTSSAIAFDLTSDVADLGRVPPLRHAAGGSGHLHASGGIDLGARSMAATITAQAQNIARERLRVDAASLDAQAVGSLADPEIHATIRSRGIVVGERRLTTAEVNATGKATSPRIEASVRSPDMPDVDATVDLDVNRGISLDGLRVALAHAGEHALLTAQHVRFDGAELSVNGAHLEGLGAPLSASLTKSKNAFRLRASTDGLDVERVARLVQIERHVHGGTLSLDTDLDVGHSSASGHATFGLAGVSVGSTQGITADVHVDAIGRRFVARAHVQAPGVGSVDVDAPNVRIAGAAPLMESSWRELSGQIAIGARGDLAKVAGLVPADELPLSEARGEVVLHARLGRDDVRHYTPEIVLSITTNGLVLAPKGAQSRNVDGQLVVGPPAWRLRGIDFVVDGNVDGSSGAIRLATRARDAKGDLAQLHFASPRFPFDDVFARPARLAEDLRKTPLDLSLEVPERGLGSLPDILKQHYVSGKLQAKVTLKGTLLAPNLDVSAKLDESPFSADSKAGGCPLEFDVSARYDGHRGTASVKARSDTSTALDLTGDIDAPAAQFVEAKGPPVWRASAQAHFDRFPLEAITAMGDKLVSGGLSGDVSLVNLHDDARARVELSVDDLKVGSFTYKSARLDATADGRAVDLQARIDQTEGFAQVGAHAKAGWGAAIAPSFDSTQPLDVTLASKNFRIAVLLPLVESTLDELDGRIDSDARLALDPRTRGATLSGGLALRRGTFEAVAGGGEFHDISANVRFSPDGTITVENLTASGLTGHLEGNATAHLAGMSLRSADGVIVIPSKSAIPLSAGGTQIGNVDGRIELSARTTDDHALDVNVTVPQLRVALPQESTTNAYPLGPMERVKIGAHRGNGGMFVLVPLAPTYEREKASSPPSTRIQIVTNLVDARVVKGTQIDVGLTGKVNVTSGPTTDVSGQIRLKPGGTLVVQGKKFVVEDGTVTMVGADPSNPQIVVKAGWTAPDGTVVYANFVGPLKTGKVTLQSEPPLPTQEIVQLLLYGTPDGPQSQSPTASAQNTAIATVGGEATQPLNHMLNQFGLGAVSANIDTTRSANPAPEVEIQIARDISLQIAYVLGQPPPGVNPDHTLFTLSYRFLSRWTLASTVGDAGTTILDLLWRKRY